MTVFTSVCVLCLGWSFIPTVLMCKMTHFEVRMTGVLYFFPVFVFWCVHGVQFLCICLFFLSFYCCVKWHSLEWEWQVFFSIFVLCVCSCVCSIFVKCFDTFEVKVTFCCLFKSITVGSYFFQCQFSRLLIMFLLWSFKHIGILRKRDRDATKDSMQSPCMSDFVLLTCAETQTLSESLIFSEAYITNISSVDRGIFVFWKYFVFNFELKVL